MDIVFMGSPDFAVNSLEKLIETDFINVVGVVTQPDRKRGRGQNLKPTPVKKLALEHKIEVYQPEKVSTPEGVAKLKEWQADLIVVVAYGQILSKEILELPQKGCVNVHASLLPKYRGAAPIHHAVIAGEAKSGVTTMYMAEGLDTGDMLLKKEVVITSDDTTGSLHDKLAVAGAELLVETIKGLAKDEIEPIPQDDSKSTYAAKLNKADCKVDWQQSAKEVKDFIRGLNPWPGAYTYHDGSRLKLWWGEVANEQDSGQKPGSIIVADEEEGIIVQTGEGQLLLKKLQPASRKRMSATDYVKGYEVELGSQLGE